MSTGSSGKNPIGLFIATAIICMIVDLLIYMTSNGFGIVGWMVAIAWTSFAMAMGVRAIQSNMINCLLSLVVVGGIQVWVGVFAGPDFMSSMGTSNYVLVSKIAQGIAVLLFTFIISKFAGNTPRGGHLLSPNSTNNNNNTRR